MEGYLVNNNKIKNIYYPLKKGYDEKEKMKSRIF